MKFLVLTDIHGNTEALDKLDSEFAKADAVLFAGDFCECFKTETGKPVLDALIKNTMKFMPFLVTAMNRNLLNSLKMPESMQNACSIIPEDLQS